MKNLIIILQANFYYNNPFLSFFYLFLHSFNLDRSLLNVNKWSFAHFRVLIYLYMLDLNSLLSFRY